MKKYRKTRRFLIRLIKTTFGDIIELYHEKKEEEEKVFLFRPFFWCLMNVRRWRRKRKECVKVLPNVIS